MVLEDALPCILSYHVACRYEIKFLVDGEWRVAPEWPTEGHGMTENNVLVVD